MYAKQQSTSVVLYVINRARICVLHQSTLLYYVAVYVSIYTVQQSIFVVLYLIKHVHSTKENPAWYLQDKICACVLEGFLLP